MVIKEVDSLDTDLGDLIGNEFARYAAQHKVSVNYTPFSFAAENNGEVVGLIAGHAYYNEIYVSNLILLEQARRKGIGTKLLQKVAHYFKGKGYEFIALTTYEFQAPGFYLKNGFEIEYVRENKANPKLAKYYFKKNINGF